MTAVELKIEPLIEQLRIFNSFFLESGTKTFVQLLKLFCPASHLSVSRLYRQLFLNRELVVSYPIIRHFSHKYTSTSMMKENPKHILLTKLLSNCIPNVVNKWRSSATLITPLPSLSKCDRPSTNSSALCFSRFRWIVW